MEKVDATCTTDGTKAHYTCECGKKFSDATASVEITDDSTLVIPAGHGYGSWEVVIAATCFAKGVEKRTCSDCGKAYGELDADNHTSLKHIEAKAATKDAEGNIEYWHCEDCDKYFADASVENEITKSDTVIKKLQDEPESPKTGEGGVLTTFIATLLISAGIIFCTASFGRRKKFSRN